MPKRKETFLFLVTSHLFYVVNPLFCPPSEGAGRTVGTCANISLCFWDVRGKGKRKAMYYLLKMKNVRGVIWTS